MRYSDTWFSKQPMILHGGFGADRQVWLHSYVEVVAGTLQPMHHANADGSIDVLGVPVIRMSSGISTSSYSREKMQRSLAEHAEKLKAAGAIIVKQTKNQLVARYGRETAYYVVTHITASTFFKNLDRK